MRFPVKASMLRGRVTFEVRFQNGNIAMTMMKLDRWNEHSRKRIKEIFGKIKTSDLPKLRHETL